MLVSTPSTVIVRLCPAVACTTPPLAIVNSASRIGSDNSQIEPAATERTMPSSVAWAVGVTKETQVVSSKAEAALPLNGMFVGSPVIKNATPALLSREDRSAAIYSQPAAEPHRGGGGAPAGGGPAG